MTGADPAPLILTLGLDAAAFDRLDALRRAHFPPERNLIPAHLTLFHHLPGARLAEVSCHLTQAAAVTPAFSVQIAGLLKLGRGVAFRIDAPPLLDLRARLAAAFQDNLTPQDRQGFRPHVTVQNKVDPAAARALHDQLSRDFQPWQATAEALLLWHYRGGPWETAGRHPLAGQA